MNLTIIIWQGIEITLKYTPHYSEHCDSLLHIEIRASNKEPLPISETGYRSHFFYSEKIYTLPEVEEMVKCWLDGEAKNKEWQNLQRKRQQLTLF